jgi:hypothetical protein
MASSSASKLWGRTVMFQMSGFVVVEIPPAVPTRAAPATPAARLEVSPGVNSPARRRGRWCTFTPPPVRAVGPRGRDRRPVRRQPTRTGHRRRRQAEGQQRGIIKSSSSNRWRARIASRASPRCLLIRSVGPIPRLAPLVFQGYTREMSRYNRAHDGGVPHAASRCGYPRALRA